MVFYKDKFIFSILMAVFLLIISLAYINNSSKHLTMGYCPTMTQEAQLLSEEKNYVLMEYKSATEVLNALNKDEINLGLIGRKAESTEVSPNIKERVIKSGHTLVSNQKSFIEYSQLPSIEVYTNVSNNIASDLIPASSKIIYVDKNEIIKQINYGKIVLIPWGDWMDEFELVVVMDGNNKSKEFRGVFLYKN